MNPIRPKPSAKPLAKEPASSEGTERSLPRYFPPSRMSTEIVWHVLINMKIFVAILLIAAVSAYAHAQSQSTAKVSKDDAQKVVTIISGDKAKTQTYCDIQKLGGEMEQAYEKRNLKLADELLQKIDTMEKNLGPEYAALVDGLEIFDPEKDKLGAEIMFELAALNMLCTR